MELTIDSDVLAARQGDRDAFARLVTRYRGLVSSISLSTVRNVAVSEDVAQDVFLAAWRDLGSLRSGTARSTPREGRDVRIAAARSTTQRSKSSPTRAPTRAKRSSKTSGPPRSPKRSTPSPTTRARRSRSTTARGVRWSRSPGFLDCGKTP